MKRVRVGTVDGGCVMCALPSVAPNEEQIAHAFAAALAMAETVKGNPKAFDLCGRHVAIVEMHREAHRMVAGEPPPVGAIVQ